MPELTSDDIGQIQAAARYVLERYHVNEGLCSEERLVYAMIADYYAGKIVKDANGEYRYRNESR